MWYARLRLFQQFIIFFEVQRRVKRVAVPACRNDLGRIAARASVNIYATHHPDDIHFLGYGHVN